MVKILRETLDITRHFQIDLMKNVCDVLDTHYQKHTNCAIWWFKDPYANDNFSPEVYRKIINKSKITGINYGVKHKL